MKRPVSGDDGHVYGFIEGRMFFRAVQPNDLLSVRRAYVIPESVLDKMVDAGVEIVVLIEPNRRLTSLLEDWLDFGQDYEAGGSAFRSLSIGMMGGS